MPPCVVIAGMLAWTVAAAGAVAAEPATRIANPDCSAATAGRPPVQRAWLYRPDEEWAYSHHPHIVHFGSRYRAIWSNGRRDEDAPGQRVLIASSPDCRTWTTPVPLLDVRRGQHGEAVLTAAGFHHHGGRLVAYIGSYEYRPEVLAENPRPSAAGGHLDTTLLVMTSEDGEHWDGPVDLRLPIVPNHGPQRLDSGRLIISGNIAFPHTDDPAGLAGWRMTGIYPAATADGIVDDAEAFETVARAAGWPGGLCEGSFFQTGDGVVHMLLRSTAKPHDGRLWLTRSRDRGASWSAPVPTGFSDTGAKFHFGTLPDGRCWYVGNPIGAGRTPLVLSLSRDGVTFDRHHILGDEPYTRLQDGLHKGGEYGYPHGLVHDGFLHVIVSRQKEAIEVLRVPLSAL